MNEKTRDDLIESIYRSLDKIDGLINDINESTDRIQEKIAQLEKMEEKLLNETNLFGDIDV